MGKQYGAVTPEEDARKKRAGYGTDPQKREPSVKQEDPSPPVRVVDAFHKNASVDTRPEDIHHRLGNGPNSAAAGNHTHNGADSPLLLDGVVITGSKTTGVAAVLTSIIDALEKLGATDSTT